MTNEIESLKKDAYEALRCLYIAVESDIAYDVTIKIVKYISKLEEICKELYPYEATETITTNHVQ